MIAAFSFPPIVSIALAADTGMFMEQRWKLIELDSYLYSTHISVSDVLGDFRLYSDETNKFKILIPQGEFSS